MSQTNPLLLAGQVLIWGKKNLRNDNTDCIEPTSVPTCYIWLTRHYSVVSVCETNLFLLNASYTGVAAFSVIDAGILQYFANWKDLECHL